MSKSSTARTLKPSRTTKPSIARARVRKVPEAAPSEIRISDTTLDPREIKARNRRHLIARDTKTMVTYATAMKSEHKLTIPERVELIETLRNHVFNVRPEEAAEVIVVTHAIIESSDDDQQDM